MDIKGLFDDTIHLAEKALDIRSRPHDMIEATLKMIFALAIVLALLRLIHRWIRRTQPGTAATDRRRLIKALGMTPEGGYRCNYLEASRRRLCCRSI